MERFEGILVILLLLSTVSAAARIEISEVMYDPDRCTDAHCEWAELHNLGEEEVPLRDCLFEGKNLSGSIIANGYTLIGRDELEIQNNFGATGEIIVLSFSLRNSGDTIELSGTEQCNDWFNYTSLIALAAGNDHSLEKDQTGVWKESIAVGGTPGQENSDLSSGGSFIEEQPVDQLPIEEMNVSSQEQQSQDNSSLIIAAEEESCNLSVDLQFPERTFQDDDVKFTVVVSNFGEPAEITIKGKIVDSSGKEIKRYSPWTNERIVSPKEKTYTPKLAKGEYQASFSAYNTSCNDLEAGNNEISTTFTVGFLENNLHSDESAVKEKDTFRLAEVPTIITAGNWENITAEVGNGGLEQQEYVAWVYLYSGSICHSCNGSLLDRNYSLQQFNLQPKEHRNLYFKIPVDKDMEAGEYKLKVKLRKAGQKTEQEIIALVNLQLAQKKTEENTVMITPDNQLMAQQDEKMIKLNSEQTTQIVRPEVVYESSLEKAKKIIPYILIIILTLLCLWLGLRRKA